MAKPKDVCTAIYLLMYLGLSSSFPDRKEESMVIKGESSLQVSRNDTFVFVGKPLNRKWYYLFSIWFSN